jgi:hypothetical protein
MGIIGTVYILSLPISIYVCECLVNIGDKK